MPIRWLRWRWKERSRNEAQATQPLLVPPESGGPLQPLAEAWGRHADLLMQAEADPVQITEAQERCQQILRTMINRNLAGMQAEQRRQPARAIELYEANVADGFFGGRPYARLIAIYVQLDLIQDARRVAQCWIDNSSDIGSDEALTRTCRRLLAASGRREATE